MKRITNIKHRLLYAILIIGLAAAVAGVFLGLSIGSPENSQGTNAVSAMLLSDDQLYYDEEQIAQLPNANVNPAEVEEEETFEESEQEAQEEEEETSSAVDNSIENSDIADFGQADSGQMGAGSESEGAETSEAGDNISDAGNSTGGNTGVLEQLPTISNGEAGNTSDGEEDSMQAGDAYFTTSIIDNDQITYSEYYFTLTHLQTEYQPMGISVICNTQEAEYRGTASSFQIDLSEGKNTVIVKVLYEKDGSYVTAFRSYTIYYSTGESILIVTDLENVHTVAVSDLKFYAYGMKGEKRIQAVVSVNGKKLTGENDQYLATLVYGTNTITITAGGRADSVTKEYRILYQENQFKITTSISDTVITNDTQQADYEREELTIHADTENYRFYVNLNQETGLESIERVRFGDATVSKDGDGYYTITLSQRKPIYLVITYKDSEGTRKMYKYLLRFQRNQGNTPEDKYPTIYAQVEVGSTVMNLEDGLKFKTPDIITNITALSWNNEQLYYGNYQVSVNGQVLPQHSYQTGVWFGYDTYLTVEGANTISVTATDYDGYSVTKTWTVYYEKGDVTVTVSVEATTVGLGYLIPPTTVTVPGGTSTMDIVCDLLEQNGYGYSNTGGTYLATITKPGICNGYYVDPDLIATILEDGMDATGMGDNPTPASMDSLGEFDFYRYSGWMYSYNGSYPGYGMNVCKPQDGSVIRVRYTLALGKDIGGFSDAIGGDYGAYNGNYDREW